MSAAVVREVLNRIQKMPESDKVPVVVFDLDETLIDNRAGTLAALRRWASLVKEPEVVAKVEALKSPEDVVAGSPEETLGALGFPKDHWTIRSYNEVFRQNFFTPDSVVIKLGKAFPGATDFAEAIEKAGGHIVFLTGRVGPSQQAATEASLRSVGLLGQNVRMLATKYDHVSTPQYKRESMELLEANCDVVAVFDNDRANLDAMKPSPTLRVHVPVADLYAGPAWKLMLKGPGGF